MSYSFAAIPSCTDESMASLGGRWPQGFIFNIKVTCKVTNFSIFRLPSHLEHLVLRVHTEDLVGSYALVPTLKM